MILAIGELLVDLLTTDVVNNLTETKLLQPSKMARVAIANFRIQVNFEFNIWKSPVR